MQLIDSVRVALLLAPVLVVATTGATSAPPNLHIRLVNSELCVAKKFNHTKDGNPIQLWSCKVSPNEDWIYDASAGTIVLASDKSKCLSTKYAHTNDGNPVHLWACKGKANQLWSVAETHGGALRIRPKANPAKCLSYPKGNAKEGAALQLWSCSDPPDIRWTHALVTGPQRVLGDSCKADSDCISGDCSCENGWCSNNAPRRCRTKDGKATTGDYCIFGSDCASGNCKSSECIMPGADLAVVFGYPQVSNSPTAHTGPIHDKMAYMLVEVQTTRDVTNAKLTCTLRASSSTGPKATEETKTINVKTGKAQLHSFTLKVLPRATFYASCRLEGPAGSVPDPDTSNNTRGRMISPL